jgi:hypothetical protein
MLNSIEVLNHYSTLIMLLCIISLFNISVFFTLIQAHKGWLAIISVLVLSPLATFLGRMYMLPTMPVSEIVMANKITYPKVQNLSITCEEGYAVMSASIALPGAKPPLIIDKEVIDKGLNCSEPLEVRSPAVALVIVRALKAKLSPSEQKAFVEQNNAMVAQLSKNAKPRLFFE